MMLHQPRNRHLKMLTTGTIISFQVPLLESDQVLSPFADLPLYPYRRSLNARPTNTRVSQNTTTIPATKRLFEVRPAGVCKRAFTARLHPKEQDCNIRLTSVKARAPMRERKNKSEKEALVPV